MANKELSGDSGTLKTESGDDKPQYVTKEELQEIVSQVTNSAITQRTKSFEKKMEEMFAKLTNPVNDAKPSDKEESVSKAEMLAMKKQLAEYAAKEEQLALKEKDTKLREVAKEYLTKIGVPQHLIRGATATLIDADKSFYFDEDMQPKFKTSMGELDAETGFRQWAKSSDGKSFLPAKGANGSGAKTLQESKEKTSSNISNEEMTRLFKELKG